MSRKLAPGEIHLLRLTKKGQNNPSGWAAVSKPVYPLAAELPSELVELSPMDADGRGRCRLTADGEAFLKALEWL